MVEKYDITLSKGFGDAKKRSTVDQKKQNPPNWSYMGVVGQIGYNIAVPLVGATIIGSIIDRKLGTAPRGTLLGLGIGMTLSLIGFVQFVREQLKS